MLRPRLRARDDAVSTVVSAVLVFALVLMVVAVYTSTMVPDQVSASEARHMRRVSSGLGDLATQLATTASLQREGEFSAQVDLGTAGISSLSFFESSGTLSMEPGSFFANFLCEGPRVIARDGHASPGSSFVALGGAPVEFQSLPVAQLSIDSYTFGATDDTATLAITSGGNAVATVTFTLVSSTTSIRVTTYDGASRVVVDQPVATNLGATIDSFVLDALDPAFGFASLLADSQGPFLLTSTTTTAAVQFYGAFWTEDGTLDVEGEGRDLPLGFQRTVNPSALVFRSSNAQFLEQTYSLEGGAVVLAQERGQYLSLAPFSITTAAGQNLLRLSLLNLTGEGQVAGSHRATISATVTDPTISILECTPPTILVSSAYPEAWYATWTDALSAAGLAESQATLLDELVEVRLTGTWIVVLEEAHVNVRIS
ncbi:MAG: hypothetical protein HYT80_11310 [Euryarchaeota archaeon]|nr:hypothetical protein [Euryarchaeota archaeon]